MLDIRTHSNHDNAGYSLTDKPDAILFDYVDQYADEPTVMLAVLYLTGLDNEPRTCEHGHDIEPGQPVIDIPDRTGCFMCPVHFHDATF